jgi:hypothetical protein
MFKTDLYLTDRTGTGPIYITTGDDVHHADLYHVKEGSTGHDHLYRKPNANAFGTELCRRWNIVDRWQRRWERTKVVAQYVGGVLICGAMLIMMVATMFIFGAH